MKYVGATFYKTVVVPNLTKELMIEQRANLDTVDVTATIRWINECEAVRKSRRFGFFQEMPPRPELTGVTVAAKFLCTKNDCRGIVLVNKCYVCNLNYCVHCRELDISDKVHECDPSAKEVVSSSKPCPKCMFPIYHNGGCPAMLCTHCNTHFDWNTMQIQMSNSSEYKPIDVFGKNCSSGSGGGVQPNGLCEFSNDYPRIPVEVMVEQTDKNLKRFGEYDTVQCPPDLFYALYSVTNSCRSFKKKMFDETSLSITFANKTRDMRVDYLRNKLSDATWSKQVFSSFMKYQSHMLHASIVNIYLSSTDDFQVRVRDAIVKNSSLDVYETIICEYEHLVSVCNESFNSLHLDNPISFAPFHINSIKNTNSDDLCCGFFAKENEFDDTSVSVVNKPLKKSSDCNSELDESKSVLEFPPIVLFEYQVSHVARLTDILKTCHFALDFSMLGAGKTYAAMSIYKNGKYKRGLIISPASVVQKWKDLAVHYGLEGIEVRSFNEMSGSKLGNNTKVGHLIRRCDSDLLSESDDKHAVTSLFRSYVKKGILVIIDEIQNIKNKGTAKTSACKEVVCAIKDAYNETNGSCKSRALLISGSPIDNYKQVEQFFKTVGIMISSKFTQFDIGSYSRARKTNTNVASSDIGNIEKGIFEIRKFCNQYDQEETNDIWSEYGLIRNDCVKECYEYFVRIVKPFISSYMVVVGNPHTVYKYNGKYELTPGMNLIEASKNSQSILLKRGIRLIKKSMNRTSEDGHPIMSAEILARMQRGLSMVEASKIPLLVQLVKETAKKNPMCKIVVACNFTSTITDLVSELLEFSPQVLNGSVLTKHRQNVLKPFQEPNLNSRLLIGNLHVLSSGIDLDDKHGNYPRICFVNPNYHTIDLYQFSYRFLRSTDTKSDSEINLVYIKDSVEQHLMTTLAKKGEIMKAVTIEQANEANVIFPCDYPERIAEPPIDTRTWNQECTDIYCRIQHN
jgi:hypothetical protein